MQGLNVESHLLDVLKDRPSVEKSSVVPAGLRELMKRVEIYAFRPVVPTPPPPNDPVVNCLPARFNADSQLKADVLAGGGNHFDFDVSEKP